MLGANVILRHGDLKLGFPQVGIIHNLNNINNYLIFMLGDNVILGHGDLELGLP